MTISWCGNSQRKRARPLPTVDHPDDAPVCKIPGCGRTCARREITPQGRFRYRAVCYWHHEHPNVVDPAPDRLRGRPTVGNPFAPRACAFPNCKRMATSLGLRKDKRVYAKWCVRHRQKLTRDLAMAADPKLVKALGPTRTADIPSPYGKPGPQKNTSPKRPLRYPPPPPEPVEMSAHPRYQKFIGWTFGPAVPMNAAIIDPNYPGSRVVMNDAGYVVWATRPMIRTLDSLLQRGKTSTNELIREMMAVKPKTYWRKKSPIAGNTTPRVTSALILVLTKWLGDRSMRRKLKLPMIEWEPTYALPVTGRTAEQEAAVALGNLAWARGRSKS